MPDGGRRKSTDAVRTHALVGFPPGDGVQPSKTSVIEPIYLFGSAHVGAATISPYPRPVETVHTSNRQGQHPTHQAAASSAALCVPKIIRAHQRARQGSALLLSS